MMRQLEELYERLKKPEEERSKQKKQKSVQERLRLKHRQKHVVKDDALLMAGKPLRYFPAYLKPDNFPDMFNLDTPILQFATQSSTDSWTIRHAVEGVQIFGGIGSGKSSGSGKVLAMKYLSHGYGGLVLTAKPDEKDMWIEYCSQSGRLNDLILVEPNGKHRFNFLEYESTNSPSGRALTENLVNVLKTVIQAAQGQEGAGHDDGFWETAIDMLIFNIIDLCQMAYDTVSVERLYDIAQTLPKAGDLIITRKEELQALRQEEQSRNLAHRELTPFENAMIEVHGRITKQIDAWYDAHDPEEAYKLHSNIDYNDWINDNFPDARLFNYIRQFFLVSYCHLNEKTRSIIDFIFQGFLYRLLREPIYSLFCKGQSTFTPEDSLNGKIILINLPVKTYFKVGRDSQILFKYIWQRAMEKRDIKNNDRPVFLWADEAQNFIHEHDAVYQATARSSRISTVYITQNMANYYASMNGTKSEHRVKSFLGTLATKIFHANADVETNHYASDLIGKAYFEDVHDGLTISKDFSRSKNRSLILESVVRPEEFVSLKTGGNLNNFEVEGIIHRQGDAIFRGRNHMKIKFQQR